MARSDYSPQKTNGPGRQPIRRGWFGRIGPIAQRIAARLIWITNAAVPKRASVVLNGDATSDQMIALANQLARRDIAVTWLTPDGKPRCVDVPNSTRLIKRWSARGVWAFMRARWVFHTHGIFGNLRPPATQTIVNVWHGMPIKLIGPPAGGDVVRSTLAVATSEEFQLLLADTWAMPPENVLVTGQPRTDRMIEASARSPEIRQRMDLATEGAVWLWLPTYRQTDSASGKRDGRETNSVFQLDIDPGALDALNDWLVDHKTTILIKPHPLSVTRHLPFPDLSNIRRIDESWLIDHEVTLYQLLGVADGLITDLSSVWVDFLMLDRPIIFSIGDLDEFLATRGSYFEDVESILPGPVIKSLAELRSSLATISSGIDDQAPLRQIMLSRFHAHIDASSTERLLAAVEQTGEQILAGEHRKGTKH